MNRKYMYKMVFRFVLIFKKLKIGRGRVETGRRSSHSPLALIRAKLRPQIGGPDVDGIGVVDVGVDVNVERPCVASYIKNLRVYSISSPFD